MSRRLHPLEIRPFRDTRVHASAFSRMVGTVQIFDHCDRETAIAEALRMLDAGKFRLKVEHGHAAYQATRKI